MKKISEIRQLPFHVDQARLLAEISTFSDTDWMSHAQEAAGNSSLPLISVGGTRNIDYAISGPMQQTLLLAKCPYLIQVLQAFESPLSRCRLLCLASNTGTPAQLDHSYHAFRRHIFYVPIITHPNNKLFYHDKEINMVAGEVWTFDQTQHHKMVNPSNINCIYLVVETKGSAQLESMLTKEQQPSLSVNNIPYLPNQKPHILLEGNCFQVLTPEEINELTAITLSNVESSQISPHDFQTLTQAVTKFRKRWAKQFLQFGHHNSGELAYQDLILYCFEPDIAAVANNWLQDSGNRGKQAVAVIRSMLSTSKQSVLLKPLNTLPPLNTFSKQIKLADKNQPSPAFESPIFIISAPRAGSTLLFETLSQFPEIWTIGEESHELIEAIPELHPAAHNYQSNRLSNTDASADISTNLHARFARQLQDRDGQKYIDLPLEQRPSSIRMLEKTPKNTLRIPFLKAVFPGARFIFLYRDPSENISSMVEGWRAQLFNPYPSLPGWPYREWSFLLVPGWKSLIGRSVMEIAAYQWQVANATILEDLSNLSQSEWSMVTYADLLREPKQTIHRIAQFSKLQWDERIEKCMSQSLPVSSMTLSTPSADKWRKNKLQLASILPSLEPVIKQVEAMSSTRLGMG